MSSISAIDESMDGERQLHDTRQAIEARLAELVDTSRLVPENLRAAMHHALLAPSKRVRPVMVYLLADPSEDLHVAAMDVGCAVEMVHTASLILDDLPCMDDAKMRRQRPTAHVAFGEATAILSAIALLNRAYGILAEIDVLAPAMRARLAEILSQAVGWDGLVAGQELDINHRSKLGTHEEIERLNWLKTGVLFVAAAEMGAVLRGVGDREIDSLKRFARHVGLAFQTADDLLDRTATVAEAGKDVGKDGGKTTLVSLLGVESARLSFKDHLARADTALLESGIDPTLPRALIARLFNLRAQN